MVKNEMKYLLGPDPDGGKWPIMPLGRVHLVGGASGSGKTRLLNQILKAAQDGKPFLGYPTQHHPVAYIAFDRRVDEQEETMDAAGLDPAAIGHIYHKVALPDPNKLVDFRAEETIAMVLQRFPGTKIILMDAFFILAAHGQTNNYLYMAEWLQRMGDVCHNSGLTIVGIVHTAKQRQGDRIIDPRYSIMGSCAVGGFTSCQIIVEQPDMQDKDRRKVSIYPRNAKERQFDMRMNENGVLVTDFMAEDNNLLILETGVLKPEAKTLAAISAEMEQKTGISKRTTQRWLEDLEQQGRAVKIGHGFWRRTEGKVINTNGQSSEKAPWQG